MITKLFRIHVLKAPWVDAIEFIIAKSDSGNSDDVYSYKLVKDKLVNRTDVESPTGEYISTEAATHLMSQLWQCGIRPPEAEDSIGQLEATERHLRDLQKYMGDLLADKLK
jgi:hypothetical protein